MESQESPNVLKVSVAEDIKTAEAGMGMGQKKAPEKKEITPEEVIQILGRYVEPHNKKSRWVTKDDLERLVAESQVMMKMFAVPRGIYGNMFALAHSQIESGDPLRFFVTQSGEIIINPVIYNHSKHTMYFKEGCMSYPQEPMKELVECYNKINMKFQTLRKTGDKYELTDMMDAPFDKLYSKVLQHECGHLNGQHIYDKDYSPEKNAWLGDGPVEDLDKLYVKE